MSRFWLKTCTFKRCVIQKWEEIESLKNKKVLEKPWNSVFLFPYDPCLNTRFCLLSVSCLVVELFCSNTHDRYANSVLYYRQPGRWYHYSHTNGSGESAASQNDSEDYLSKCVWLYVCLHAPVCLPVCMCLYFCLSRRVCLSTCAGRSVVLALSVCLSICVHLHVCLSSCVCLYFCLHASVSLHAQVCISASLRAYICVCLSAYLSTYIHAFVRQR